MKLTACLLCLCLLAPAWGRNAEPAPASQPPQTGAEPEAPSLKPFVITAPPERKPDAEAARLKSARAAGGVAVASGTGLMIYSVFFAAGGAVVWAGSLLLLGGLTMYLSHRRLKGKDDFGPADLARAAPTPAGRPRFEPPATAAASPAPFVPNPSPSPNPNAPGMPVP